jgi:hypothetical protein
LEKIAEAATPRRGFFGGVKDEFDAVLSRFGRTYPDFDHSGYVLATVLPYLADNGVDLMKSEYAPISEAISSARGCSCFVITQGMRERHEAALAALSVDEDALAAYYQAFHETDGTDAGPPMVAGIVYLRSVLAATTRDMVAILIIG